MNSLAEQIIVDILGTRMALAAGSIWIRDQSRKIPPGNGLYVVVGMVDAASMSSLTYMEEKTTPQPEPAPPLVEQVEINRVSMRENIQIDIFSRSNAAILRRWEILAALRSIYSQQQQEENYFKIFRIPSSFVNSSIAEGGSQLNRYTVTVPCFVWYKKETILDPDTKEYYDSFETRVDDEKTIGTEHGIFEFTITEE
jgi:hypothetical protein